jgi:hypothetical protein
VAVKRLAVVSLMEPGENPLYLKKKIHQFVVTEIKHGVAQRASKC